MKNTKNQPAGLALLPAILQHLPLSDARLGAELCLRDFAKAQGKANRDAALIAALDYARVLSNIIGPLCDRAYPGTNVLRLVIGWAETLRDLARPWVEDHEFPEAPDQSSLILDNLENLQLTLNAVIARRQRRAAGRRVA